MIGLPTSPEGVLAMNFVTGEVAFAAIIDPVRCLPSDPAYYVVFLTNEEWFASVTQPRLSELAGEICTVR
jgi:hypothetical protein